MLRLQTIPYVLQECWLSVIQHFNSIWLILWLVSLIFSLFFRFSTSFSSLKNEGKASLQLRTRRVNNGVRSACSNTTLSYFTGPQYKVPGSQLSSRSRFRSRRLQKLIDFWSLVLLVQPWACHVSFVLGCLDITMGLIFSSYSINGHISIIKYWSDVDLKFVFEVSDSAD